MGGPVKVLLAQNMYYLPSHGGANKSNRLIMERLAGRGHACHVVAPVTGRLSHIGPDRMPGYLAERGGEVLEHTDRILRYRHEGVTVHGVLRAQDLPRTVMDVAGDLGVDWTLVPSDDPGMMMLSAALRSTKRVLYLVHTLQQLPFGPRSFRPSRAATAMIGRAAGLVSVSRAAQEYVERWAGLGSELIYPDIYSCAPVRDPRPAEQKYVTLVNPCGYKGIDVFLALADALPQVPFLAVESWGMTDRDRAALAARPNVVVHPGADDMEQVYGRTKVLLMPSLWDETFGYCSVEAMLRGIPVLAADVGGLREAKLGVGRLLPVRPITRYPGAGPVALPDAEIPAQDVAPWLDALRELLGDEEGYGRLARESRRAARGFVAGLDPDAIEAHLTRLSTPVPR
ncbi:glycosyltransferase family 4 protein [Streptomyces sp. CB02460]|uniref:glycosyltransferase family 4 protein n=1 Tax=Streptomyces sp. CB02460 TaxID=1703941 RepID=UPI00093F6A69|nr:glycosyltransferase family 4 protein [Streptomyces sp. CB02460]